MYAIITGASSGLGKEFAKILSKKKYNIILVARRKIELEKLKIELEEEGINVMVIDLDLSQNDNCYKLFNIVADININLLINNAGAGYIGNFFDTDLDRQMKIIKLNIEAPQILTKLFIEKNSSGKIINIGSLAGCLPTPNHAVYSSSKAYINNFSRAINFELKKNNKNIKILTALPGPVKTEFSTNASAEINRGMDAQKCAKLILKASDKNKERIIPGLTFKILYFLIKIIPDKLLMKFAYNIQKSK
ncbi:SDR family NAD(P)-dependent oxidoreductase [Candidatus Izemoplasma sp. B36]|uniref:SDR family NAD(P)-dependent oxidoreductase n=1 Tax=Candidatus Izemoplasma sp. B36 TaxID=3242468 RepID=UPI003557DB02